MEIRNETSTDRSGILDLIVVLKNQGNNRFKGHVHISVPSGFRNILDTDMEADLGPGESAFLPVKIIVTNNASSGLSNVVFDLRDMQGRVVDREKIEYRVAENTTMRITAENPVIFINSEHDSIIVRARVANLGNKKQDVTVVFKLPDADQGNLFTEQKGSIGVQKDTVFIVRFLPTPNMLKNPEFTINVAAFREPDKEIFGNASISIQNVSSSQRYRYEQNSDFANSTKNTITASYRRIGETSNMYQLTGSGGFNLPSGYLFARGNIYTINNQNDPIVNNTYISYHRGGSTFTLGNISRLMEMSLFGRGAEYSYTTPDKNRKLEMGFVDQTFSLIERNAFLKYGYGFYVRGAVGELNDKRGISAGYVFRNDPYEHADHNLAGSDFRYAFNKDWRMNGRIYGGLSSYQDLKLTKPSLAVESQYSGIIKKVNLNGNYFYSSDYYPGNRRGVLQIQQNISAQLYKEYSVYGNLTISDFSPKYYFLNTNLQSNSTRFDGGLNFPRKGNFGLGVSFQYQQEKSNTYNNFFDTTLNEESKQLVSRRLTEYLNWSSSDLRHSAGLGLEAGLVNYPDMQRPKYQMKAVGNYNYKWLSVSFSYQYGSYFLSEYAFSKLFNQANTYKKVFASAFVNQNFFNHTLNLNSGLSYTDDILYGKSPSGFVNLKYNKERYGVFLNSSWFNYASRSTGNNIFTIEAGVSLYLASNTLNAGKKGDIHAFVYYDYNDNNIYDDGDKPAEGYLIMLNNISFKTDKEGTLAYNSVPFGKYPMKQIIQQGWYYDECDVELNKYNYSMDIPLHQNGTVQGSILYDYDAKTALEFSPKTGGIVFNIYRNDKLLQRTITDDNGEFVSFLESGVYRIELNQNSLPANTYCERTAVEVNVQAGKIKHLEPFMIRVKTKNIRVKKFGED
ncbi:MULTISPECIES: COG1470 family protein [Chryseobacterium]|nr:MULTISPECIES: hypothetical protein [Chryseobacterium]